MAITASKGRDVVFSGTLLASFLMALGSKSSAGIRYPGAEPETNTCSTQLFGLVQIRRRAAISMQTTTETPPQLSASRVTEIFRDCLFNEGEDTSNNVPAEGIKTTVGFHLERLQSYKDEVAAMLDELSDDFKPVGGGGTSFLNACDDKHGRQWADLHQTMEQLFQLGIALGKVTCLMPRVMWDALPGGVPYYLVDPSA